MNYKVKLHPKVVKFLEKSDLLLRERLLKKLKLLKEEPFRYLQHYSGDSYYKLRIGDYRALVTVDQARNLIFVRVLEHRSKIYTQNL